MSFKKIFLALEEEELAKAAVDDEAAPEAIDVSDAIETSENEEEVAELSNSVEEAAEEAETVVEEVSELQDQVDAADEKLEEAPESVTVDDVAVAQEAFQMSLARLGFNPSEFYVQRVSHEDMATSPARALRLVNEGVKETIKNIIEKIKTFFKGVWEMIKNLFVKVANLFRNYEKQIFKLKNKLNSNKNNIDAGLGKIEDYDKVAAAFKPVIGYIGAIDGKVVSLTDFAELYDKTRLTQLMGNIQKDSEAVNRAVIESDSEDKQIEKILQYAIPSLGKILNNGAYPNQVASGPISKNSDFVGIISIKGTTATYLVNNLTRASVDIPVPSNSFAKGYLNKVKDVNGLNAALDTAARLIRDGIKSSDNEKYVQSFEKELNTLIDAGFEKEVAGMDEDKAKEFIENSKPLRDFYLQEAKIISFIVGDYVSGRLGLVKGLISTVNNLAELCMKND